MQTGIIVLIFLAGLASTAVASPLARRRRAQEGGFRRTILASPFVSSALLLPIAVAVGVVVLGPVDGALLGIGVTLLGWSIESLLIIRMFSSQEGYGRLLQREVDRRLDRNPAAVAAFQNNRLLRWLMGLRK